MSEEEVLRLQPIPDSFICPISCSVMVSPVATVDGNVYDREYIEQWIRTCRQRQQPITSPLTGVKLPATNIIPIVAVQKAIEAYVANRPELRFQQSAKRSVEHAASMLQAELREKQAVNGSIQDEIDNLKVVEGNLAQEQLKQNLNEYEATVSEFRTCCIEGQKAHRATLSELASARNELERVKVLQICSRYWNSGSKKNQCSMSDF